MNNICFLIAAYKNHNQTMRLINHLKKDFYLYVRMQSNLKKTLENDCLRYLVWKCSAPIVLKLNDYNNMIMEDKSIYSKV